MVQGLSGFNWRAGAVLIWLLWSLCLGVVVALGSS